MQGDEDVFVIDYVCHSGVCPYCGFHLAAVDASEACEIKHDRHAVLLGVCHSLIIILEAWRHVLAVEVEVLGIDGWCKGADCLAGCSPEAGYHVDCKGECCESCHKAYNACTGIGDDGSRLVILVLVMGQADEM